MADKPDLKVLSFTDYQKKAERKKKVEDFIIKLKSLFHIKKGFEKYRVVQWGTYSDTGSTYVILQNLKSGKIKEKVVSRVPVDKQAVELFVRNLW